MQITKIDENFATSGQIALDDVAGLARTGFRSIVCIRPDHEDAGAPNFLQIAKEAEKVGLKAAYVPYAGSLNRPTVSDFKLAMQQLPKPVLGYCRSGARASTLYSAYKAS